jgi:Meiotically up-regulated protein Msb1/Mug8 domain
MGMVFDRERAALGTLGVMRPHWFASSHQQEIQLQLISRFLQCLSSSKSNASASGSTSPSTTFESELRYTRDPHDVAAVLRWGLRHLQLDGNSFSSSSTVDWYQSFVDSERSGSYPSKAFDTILVPLLPASHSQLLRAILDLVSSLAAHSEENGISGNKLSKVLGWWIISSRNVQGLGWREFYAQWEAAARQFEHLFLAYIR